MQRLHRYGTVAFTLCLLALIFHLIALSYNTWLKATCNKCPDDDFFKRWTVSISQRCYQVSMNEIFNAASDRPDILNSSDALRTEFCLPRQHLYARRASTVDACFGNIVKSPHLVCSLGLYDPTKCKCDFSSKTKAIIALAVISSVCLGVLVILTHFTSYISHDVFINSLVRGGLVAMIISFICMLSILIIVGTSKYQDSQGLSGYLLFEDFLDEMAAGGNITNIINTYQKEDYSVTIGWSFGIEIVAIMFTLSTAVIYALMLTAKRRPE